jgi:hypothetical protein
MDLHEWLKDVAPSPKSEDMSNCSSSSSPLYTCVEKYDLDVARHLLHGRKMMEMRSRPETSELYAGISDAITIAMMNNGEVPVSYRLGNGAVGRMHATSDVVGDLSPITFTNMKREIRAHLACKHYDDIDIANCAPTLLYQIGSDLVNLSCLKAYNDNRDARLRDLSDSCGVSLSDAKNLILRLIFLGSISKWAHECSAMDALPGWIFDFQEEMKTAIPMLAQSSIMRHTRLIKKSNDPHSIVATYIFDCERRCILSLAKAVEDDDLFVGALVHDGILVTKLHPNKGPSTVTLRSWEEHIYKSTGYCVHLTVKSFAPDPCWLCPGDAVSLWPPILPRKCYSEMKVEWETKMCKIQNPSNFIRVEEGSRVRIYSKNNLMESYEPFAYAEVVRDPNGLQIKTRPFVPRWLKDPMIRQYDCLEFKPPPLTTDPRVFNIWTPFAVQNYRPVRSRHVDIGSAGVHKILCLIDTLCAHRNNVTAYLLDWLAQLFKNPGLKSGVAVVLQGEEGVGKNRLTDLLCLMIGTDKCLETAEPGTKLYGRFNNQRQGCVLAIVNESSSKDNFSNDDQLKDMITGTSFQCEGKGTNAFSVSCYLRLIFTSNHGNVVKSGPGSRRYFVIDVSSELKGNSAFFNELSECIDDPHTRLEFYSYLVSRDISHIVNWQLARPITEDQACSIQMNMTLEQQFIREIVLEASDNALVFTNKDLREMYNVWADGQMGRGSRRHTSETAFGMAMNRVVFQMDKNMGLPGISRGKGTHRTYTIDIPVALESMRACGWISDP